MKPNVVLWGAGGHTRSLIPVVQANALTVKAVYDDSFHPEKPEMIANVPLLGTIADCSGKELVVLSFGDAEKRAGYFQKYHARLLLDNIIHPSAIIEDSVQMGNANQIFAGTVLNAQANIGDNNIINTGAIIEHESKIGSHNHISVGSIIAGRVKLGDYCFIGAGAVVIDKLYICSHVTIGANAVVVRDITEAGVYVGNPAKRIK